MTDLNTSGAGAFQYALQQTSPRYILLKVGCLFSHESAGAAVSNTLHFELINNLISDQRYFIDVDPTDISGAESGSAIHYQVNWEGNSSFAPGSNHFGAMFMRPVAAGTTAYFNDNHANLWTARADWDLNYCCGDHNGGANARPAWGLTARRPFPTVAVLPAAGVRANAVANAGAFPRDPVDRRLMANVSAGTFDSRAINVNPANDALALNFTAQQARPPRSTPTTTACPTRGSARTAPTPPSPTTTAPPSRSP